jgi:hypothetical protein
MPLQQWVSIILIFVQGFIGYGAVHVSLKPPKSRAHIAGWRYAFFGITLIGIGLSSWLVYLTGESEKRTTVTVDLIGFVDHGQPRISRDHPVEVGVSFKNAGLFTAREFLGRFGLWVPPQVGQRSKELDEQVFDNVTRMMRADPGKERSDQDLDPGMVGYSSLIYKIQDNAVDNVLKHQQFLYLIGWTEWTDGGGPQTRDFCYFFDPDNQMWRYCLSRNGLKQK